MNVPGGAREEIVLPFAVPRNLIMPPKNVRSTLIASSLRAIRDHGRFDQYASLLPREWRDLPTRAIAGVWLPIDAGIVHYRTCDALNFTSLEQLAIGRETGDRIHGTFLGTMIHAARGAGVTPWIALMSARKLYERLFDGGGICVVKVGPKDARVELVENPLNGIPYFRNAMRGLWCVALELFCNKAYVNEIGRTETSCKARIAWA